MDLNYSITSLVLCHWCTRVAFLTLLLISSNKSLLTFPSSGFAGFINRHWIGGLTTIGGGLLTKLSLWSFMVMNAAFIAKRSSLSSIPKFSAMILASVLMLLYCVMSDFLCFSNIFSVKLLIRRFI